MAHNSDDFDASIIGMIILVIILIICFLNFPVGKNNSTRDFAPIELFK